MWKVNTGIAQSKPRATPGLVPRGMARATDLRLPWGKKKRLGRRALDMDKTTQPLRSRLGFTARAGRSPRGWFCCGLTSQHVHKPAHFSPRLQKGSGPVVKVHIRTRSVPWYLLGGLTAKVSSSGSK